MINLELCSVAVLTALSPCAHWDASCKLGALCSSGVAASQSSCAAAFACDGICTAAAVPFLLPGAVPFLLPGALHL